MVVSIPVSIALYLCLKSVPAAIASFLTGVFIDIDHFPDYLLHCRFRGISLREFFHTCHNVKLSRLHLFFHSYEIVPILFLAGFLTGWNNIVVGITVGFITHIILDQFTNMKHFRRKALFYFLSYRLSKNFRREALTNR